MNYDVPKLSQRADYVIERSIENVTPKQCVVINLPTNQDHPEKPDLGGYPFVASGTGATGASNVSLSQVRTYEINFVPRDGAYAPYEMEKQQVAHTLEQIINPSTIRDKISPKEIIG